ncbi:hypothetical protein [Streptomyces monomycini]|uniref:hypothetical protein n=1 Tax=Streptomyces monomycini TaxID=371720 RepID=UPI0004A9E42C|nr:hypothetical protein [Streptomyces monomycini]
MAAGPWTAPGARAEAELRAAYGSPLPYLSRAAAALDIPGGVFRPAPLTETGLPTHATLRRRATETPAAA